MSVNGLPNIGLSCYINSVLQAFFYIKEIRTYIMKTNFVDKNSFVFYLQCVFKILDNVPDQANLDDIFQVFKSFCERFKESKQGDANHFLMFLLNKLDLEIKNNFNIISLSQPLDVNDRNIITDLFRGEQEDRIFCDKCNRTEDRKTKQNFFSLPISVDKREGKTIDDLLVTFFAQIEIQNISCTDCGGTLFKHTIVTRWPTYLIINICRSQISYYGEMIKLNSKVSVNDQKLTVEDLSYFYSNGENKEKIEYTLQAAINHSGNPYDGHYTCISVTDFLWVEFNDMQVNSIDVESVISNKNSLLFFKRNIQISADIQI